jgi:hypothetical protein
VTKGSGRMVGILRRGLDSAISGDDFRHKHKAPAANGGGPRYQASLKGNLRSELNAARSASTEERVADAHVAGGCERQEIVSGGIGRAPPVGVQSVRRRIGDEVWAG